MLKSTRIIQTITILISFALATYSVNAQSHTVVVNEIMASNSNTIADEDGDYSDWIELYNHGDEPVNLLNWGLSDNDSNPFKWIFPDVTIQPGEYLLVWASGKDRRPAGNSYVNGIRQEVFMDITGTSINDLLNHPRYPNSPSYTRIITDFFEAPVDFADNYGQRMHGLIKAPMTGNYRFWIASDDNGRLLLSTDENPANVVTIAEVPGWTNSREWEKYSQQRSEPIHLTQGQYYYISALMKEEQGGDNLAVRWQLPDATMEAPIAGQHLYVKDTELHTNFSISAAGEPILLTHPNGETVHIVEAIPIPGDVSYGLNHTRDALLFFEMPTPAATNSDKGYSEVLTQVPVFSHTGGFYTQPFELTITAGEDVDIYYTIDGSEPDPDNVDGKTYQYKNTYPHGALLNRQFKTFLYENSIPVADRSPDAYEISTINTAYSTSTRLPASNIFKGTVIRVKPVKENALSLQTYTHTYFIAPEGENRYDLPVISIATDEPNLFDYETGIYVAGKVAVDWRSNNTDEWNDGRPANYNQRGQEWERPAHIEFFPGNGVPAYAHNIGLRIHGGWSRAHYIKSLRLYARSAYGTGNTFEFPFFGNLPAKGDPNQAVESFRRLILRNSGNDFYSTYYRDALMQDLVKHLPFETQAYQPVVHFINGEFWGIINMRERYDQYYIASHYNLDPDDVVIMEAWGSIDVGTPQDRTLFYDILSYAESNNMALPTHYDWVKQRVDIESLAQFYAAQIYFQNTDWPQNNMTFWRSRSGEWHENAAPGKDGRWRWMLYDVDFGMNLYGSNQTHNGLSRVMSSSASDPSSRLFRRLLNNADFKNYFINAVADQLNTCFNAAYISQKVDAFNARLANTRNEHWNRWRSGNDLGGSIKTFASQRPANYRSHVMSQFNISQLQSLTVNRQGNGGKIRVNSIVIDDETPGIINPSSPYPWNGLYFGNVPVTLTAIDTQGFRFVRWAGVSGVDINDREISFTLSGAISATAIFEPAPTLELIHYWHFNSLDDGHIQEVSANISLTDEPAIISYPGTGTGYMDRVNDGSALNARNDFPAERGLRVRNPANTRELMINLPTTGFEEIVLKYAVTRTNNGAKTQAIYYKAEPNAPWTLFKDNIEITESYTIVTIDFSGLDAAKNNPDFAVKILFTDENAANTSGNNRFDNITVEGYTVKTDIKDVERGESVRIWPNPAVNYLNIESQHPVESIRLFDINGRLVFSSSGNENNKRIATDKFAQGIYLLHLQTSKGIMMKKIVVK